MQAQQAYSGDKRSTVAHICEQHTAQLQLELRCVLFANVSDGASFIPAIRLLRLHVVCVPLCRRLIARHMPNIRTQVRYVVSDLCFNWRAGGSKRIPPRASSIRLGVCSLTDPGSAAAL